jgi:hypothetical protein
MNNSFSIVHDILPRFVQSAEPKSSPEHLVQDVPDLNRADVTHPSDDKNFIVQ